MADTITANLGLQLPQIYPGDQWGNKLNSNFAAIDVFAGSTELTGARAFGTAALVLADVAMTYTPGTALSVVAGQYILTQSEGVSYKVAASTATDQHVSTAGGVKLYVQAGAAGYDVRAFGAVGNGVADDTAAFVSAWAAADAIYLGSGGTYKVTGLTIPADGKSLRGDFLDPPTIRLADGANAHVIAAFGRSRCGLQNIIIDGNKANQGLGSANPWRGVYFVNVCHDLRFENVRVQNTQDHGFMLSSGSDLTQRCGQDSVVIGVQALNCGSPEHNAAGGPGGSGITGGDYTTTWTGCYAAYNHLNGFKAVGVFTSCHSVENSGGFETGFVGTNSIKQTKYIACSAIGNVGDGWRHQGEGDEITHIGCTGALNGNSGITFLGGVDRAIVSDCWFKNNGQNTSGTYTTSVGFDGIFFGDASVDPQLISISGCHFLDDQDVKTQRKHVYFVHALQNIRVEADNFFGDCVDQPIYVASSARGSSIRIAAAQGLPGVVRSTQATTVTGTTSTTDLARETIPAFAYADNAQFKVVARGSVVGTNGTKLIRLGMGGTSAVLVNQIAADQQRWAIEATITHVATSLSATCSGYEVGGSVTTQALQTTQSGADDYDIVINTTLGSAADSVTIDYFSVEPV